MAKPIKPGTDNKPAGTYHEVGPRGGRVPGGRTVRFLIFFSSCFTV